MPARRTRLALSSCAEWAPLDPGTATVYEQQLPNGRFSIRAVGSARYRLEHPRYGCYDVTQGATRVLCDVPDMEPWRWQRFLVGQVLPLASLLQGLEPLHAGAVGVHGRAVVLMGPSGAGKSSVGLHLVAAAGKFMADDVTALELVDGGVVAHPGPALASVQEPALQRLREGGLGEWRSLGQEAGETRITLDEPASAPLPVGAVYVLVRDRAFDEVVVGPCPQSWPEVLLGGTFNAYSRSRDRLARQLEVAGTLAQSAPLRLVQIPWSADPRRVAEAIRDALPRESGEPRA